MKTTTASFFHIVRHFDIKGGGTGAILTYKRTQESKEEHYVANVKDLRVSDPGFTVQIPCRIKGDAVLIPEELILFATGSLEESSKSISRQYLSYLYNDPLHASRRNLSTAKNFDSKAVFAHPTLRLLESLHDTLHKSSLLEHLCATNFLYTRKKVYTRFRDDVQDNSYLTPRSLNYYPMENLIRVTFWIDGSPRETTVKVSSVNFEEIKTPPVSVQITRTFRNEGWTSLRDIAHKEPGLRAFIKMFYDNGYGRPEQPENLSK